MFDLDCFIAERRAAVSLDPTHKSVREIVARAVSEPTAVIAGLGAPARAEVQKLYNPPELTSLNVIWGPGMTITPHNHLMWAVIGIYTGREDNIFWRRLPGKDGAHIEAAGGEVVGGTGRRGARARHHPHCNQPAAAIYGRHPRLRRGFFCRSRSEWDPETLLEQPFDMEKNLRLFEPVTFGIDSSPVPGP